MNPSVIYQAGRWSNFAEDANSLRPITAQNFKSKAILILEIRNS